MARLSKYLLQVPFLVLIHEQTDTMDLGTTIFLKPGVILGGPVQHECPLSRSVGYYLEPVIMLAPFAKKAMSLTLNGITTDEKDLSVSFEESI